VPLSSTPQACKRSVQRRSKSPLGPCIVGRRSSRNDPRESCLIHEVAYREALTDCFGRVLLAARIEHRDALGDQLRCQRDILRNDQVPSGGMRSDVLVGHVWASIHPDGTHKGIPGWRLQTLVRHQDDFDGQSLGRAEYELLDIARCRIGINPDLQPLLSPMLVLGPTTCRSAAGHHGSARTNLGSAARAWRVPPERRRASLQPVGCMREFGCAGHGC
jgi:hypothetical protein